MPQTQLYFRKAQVAVKPETTVDQFLAPVGADVFLASDVTIALGEVENFSPEYVRGDYLSMDEIPGPASATISFRVPLKGSGTAGTAPEIADLLKSCGMKETVSPGVSVKYVPHSVFDGASGNPAQSYSCAVHVNGKRYGLKGGFGNGILMGEVGAGNPGWVSATMRGAYQATSDTALLVPTYDSTIPVPFRGLTLTIGGYTPKGVRAYQLDLGRRIVIGQDVNEAVGFYGARITGGRAFGSIDPEEVLGATHDFWALWRAGTVGSLNTGTVGSVAGNRWSISCPRVIRRAPGVSDRDGIAALSVPFAVCSAPGDVEVTNEDVTLLFT